MGLAEVLIVLVAGIAAGAMNAVVGAGSLVTFPTLLALGVPPVVANVSNTVGLVPGSIAGAYGFRSTLKGRGRLAFRLACASAVGGVLGGALLLALPSSTFDAVIPPLLLLAAILAAAQPRVAAWVTRRRAARAASVGPDGVGADDEPTAGDGPTVTDRPSPVLYVIVLLAGIYGGYFGAAQGVILLAVLGIFIAGGMPQVNGIKNVLAGVANLLSATLFVFVADVNWTIAAMVAIGATIGGLLGSRYGRRLPAGPLRALVVAIALVAAAWRLLS